MSRRSNRRHFLKLTGLGASASLAGGTSALGQSRHRATATPKFTLGLASYSLRKFDLDQTLAMAQRVGLKKIAFKSMHLPLDSSPEHIAQTVAKVKEAGIDLYGAGVVYMKNEAAVNQAFDYAKAAGMTVIIGVPNHDLLPLVDKKVKAYDIKVAIHNHGPGDKVYPTPTSIIERVKDLDQRIGLCIDIGHTMRLGIDPTIPIRKYANRIHDMHIKDVNAATAKGHGVEMGRGIINIPAVMKMLMAINYSGVVSFEYEKDGDDPLPGLAESVGYANGVLASLKG
jgi:inosose dehydratase